MAAHPETPHATLARPSSLLPPLVLLALFAMWAGLFWPYTCDDSYITYRFVQNLAHGLGPVFNPGGEVVEGYSNPLWLGLLWVGVKLGAEIVTLSKVLGLLAGLGTLLLAWGIARRLSGEEDRPLWLLLALAPNAGLAYYAVSGMETVPYACLLTGAVYCFLRESRAALWTGALLGLLAALTRPEGLLVMLALLGWRLVTSRGLPRTLRQAVWLSGLTSLALLAGFFLWRHAIYGLWLPNTYYAKPPGAFGTTSYLSALGYVRAYVGDIGGGVLLALALAPVLRTWRTPESRGLRVSTGAAALVVGVEMALVLHARGDWMALHRFLVPVTALLTAFGFAGLLRLTANRGLAILAAVCLAGLSLVGILEARDGFRAGTYPYAVMAGQSQVAAGRWLAQRFPPGTVLACKRIGGIAYASGLPLVDTLGLTDRRLAQIRHRQDVPGPTQYAAMAEEVLARRPDVVILCAMKRWPDLPLNQLPPDLGGNLRDVDEALYSRLAPRGYHFLGRFTQANAGELALYLRPGVQLTTPRRP